jgi:hypothetical protein
MQSSRVMVDIYSCQPGGPRPCNIQINTNDMLFTTLVYEKTAKIKDYNNPIFEVHRELNESIPSLGLRTETKYWLGYTDIITDKGFWYPDLETKKMITLFDTAEKTGEKSPANIPRNYLSQGRLFYSDLDAHIEIVTTNEKVEIYRNYYSIIDAFSAVGG